MRRWSSLLAGIVFAVCLGSVAGSVAAPDRSPEPAGGPPVMRLLTQDQYRNIVRDVFGPVSLGGRFSPDPRAAHSLIAVGAGTTSVTASSLEEYDRMARTITEQVVSPQYRDQVLPCKPASPKAVDEACTRRIITRVGHLLFRRPLTEAETTVHLEVAAAGTAKMGDYYSGLQAALAAMMVSPEFLFIQEQSEPDPAKPGAYRLTSAAMATRISFMLWNTTPDFELLRAAEQGELQTDKGLSRQVERMLASPRLETGVRAYFKDMLGFEKFEDLAKDVQLYPSYNREIQAQGQEQALRTIVAHLLRENGDYRDLFTTRRTVMTPFLASVYRVPMQVPSTRLPIDWSAYEWPAEVPQAGIVTQLGFLALHSHPGKSSPTLRGRALRENLLCQRVPDPPPNVNSVALENADISKAPTIRDRLSLHVTNPACAACHKMMDPIGFALENFNTVGAFRTTENGAPIDASGELDGVKYQDANGLGKALHDSPRTTACLVQRIYAYGAGREPTAGERQWFAQHLNPQFAQDGYRLPQLLRRILLNPGFYRVTPDNPNAGAKLAHAS